MGGDGDFGGDCDDCGGDCHDDSDGDGDVWSGDTQTVGGNRGLTWVTGPPCFITGSPT